MFPTANITATNITATDTLATTVAGLLGYAAAKLENEYPAVLKQTVIRLQCYAKPHKKLCQQHYTTSAALQQSVNHCSNIVFIFFLTPYKKMRPMPSTSTTCVNGRLRDLVNFSTTPPSLS